MYTQKMKKTARGRKPAPPMLPPLADACPEFKGFQKGESRTGRMRDILTVMIQRCRRSTPQSFYTMREMAAFFKVSLKTTARVYRGLAREGTLTLVRSCGTMIPPRTFRPRFALRGVVCMPIWMPGFLQFLDDRRFFSQLEEELSRHRFVLEAIFYRQGESEEPAFVERVLKFNPDYVLWNGPGPDDLSTLQSIGDTGVPLLVLNGTPQEFPGRIYRLSHEKAIRQGLQEWEASGEINRIVIPRLSVETNSSRIIHAALKDCSLPHRFDVYNPKVTLTDYLRRLAPSPRTGIILDDDLFYTHVCSRVPEAMLKLFRQRRVLVVRTATLPSETIPKDLIVDAILPNRRLPRQIATDLSKGRGQLQSDGFVFHAEWRSRIPLADVAQSHFAE